MFPKCLRLNFGNQFFRPEKPKFSVFCLLLQMKQTSKNENFCLPDKQKRLLSTSAPQRYLLGKQCFLILFKVVQHLIKQIFRSSYEKIFFCCFFSDSLANQNPCQSDFQRLHRLHRPIPCMCRFLAQKFKKTAET